MTDPAKIAALAAGLNEAETPPVWADCLIFKNVWCHKGFLRHSVKPCLAEAFAAHREAAIAELKAENAELKAALNNETSENFTKWRFEIEQQHLAEMMALQAENGRLEIQVDARNRTIAAMQGSKELQAENARLRAVLKSIASCVSFHRADVVAIARQALGEQP